MTLELASCLFGIVKRRAVAMTLVVASLVIVCLSIGRYALSRKDETVSLQLVQSIGEGADAQVLKGISSYLAEHPEVRVSIAYRPQVAGSVRLGSLRPNLALRAGSEADSKMAEAAAEVALSGYSLLAYDKRLVPSPPQRWADIANARLEGKVKTAFSIGIPAGAGGVVPFLGAALWPPHQVDAGAVGREAFGLMHDLTFGLGLVPRSCLAACVLHEMTEGRLPYAIVDEDQIPSLRSALGDALGLTCVPSLPVSGTPMRSSRSVVSMFAYPGANAKETAAAKELVNALNRGGARELALALGKVSAKESADPLFALVMQNTVSIDAGTAESVRVFGQSLGERFHNGELSVVAAVTELSGFRSQLGLTAEQ